MNGRIGPFVRYHRFTALSLVTVASKLRLCPCHYSLYSHFASDMFFSRNSIYHDYDTVLLRAEAVREHMYSHISTRGGMYSKCVQVITKSHHCTDVAVVTRVDGTALSWLFSKW